MLGGSLFFLLEGVSEGVSLKSERGVERGCRAKSLGNPFFVVGEFWYYARVKSSCPYFVGLGLFLQFESLHFIFFGERALTDTKYTTTTILTINPPSSIARWNEIHFE